MKSFSPFLKFIVIIFFVILYSGCLSYKQVELNETEFYSNQPVKDAFKNYNIYIFGDNGVYLLDDASINDSTIKGTPILISDSATLAAIRNPHSRKEKKRHKNDLVIFTGKTYLPGQGISASTSTLPNTSAIPFELKKKEIGKVMIYADDKKGIFSKSALLVIAIILGIILLFGVTYAFTFGFTSGNSTIGGSNSNSGGSNSGPMNFGSNSGNSGGSNSGNSGGGSGGSNSGGSGGSNSGGSGGSNSGNSGGGNGGSNSGGSGGSNSGGSGGSNSGGSNGSGGSNSGNSGGSNSGGSNSGGSNSGGSNSGGSNSGGSGGGSSSGCYIATMVYGSCDAPEVMVLRRFRDDVLSKTKGGRIFIQQYYKYSPLFVKRFQDNQKVNAVIRQVLNKFITYLSK